MHQSIQKFQKILNEPQMLFCQTSPLFLLSHMRSRSSVLSHIFGSNPEIVGYGELHRSYLTESDLYKLRFHLKDKNTKVCNKFLYDKLLHPERVIADELLLNDKLKFIFMIRSPEDTLKSILNMGSKMGNANYQSEDWVASYYIHRLEELQNYALKLNGRFLFLESDSLVEDSDKSLQDISDWLGLSTPLTKEYKTFDKTGKPGHGDPLENIKQGVLRKTKPHEIAVNKDHLQAADAAYQLCRQQLSSAAERVIEY